MSSSILSWQILTAHAQPFRGARDLAFCLKGPLDSLLVWASSGGSGETAWMCRLAWTFAARIGDKYQIRLTRPIHIFSSNFYFADWDGKNTSAIFVADLTGANLKPVVTQKLDKPGALSIDYANDHLYFADMSLNFIERVNLDGSNRRLIAIGMSVSTVFIRHYFRWQEKWSATITVKSLLSCFQMKLRFGIKSFDTIFICVLYTPAFMPRGI